MQCLFLKGGSGVRIREQGETAGSVQRVCRAARGGAREGRGRRKSEGATRGGAGGSPQAPHLQYCRGRRAIPRAGLARGWHSPVCGAAPASSAPRVGAGPCAAGLESGEAPWPSPGPRDRRGAPLVRPGWGGARGGTVRLQLSQARPEPEASLPGERPVSCPPPSPTTLCGLCPPLRSASVPRVLCARPHWRLALPTRRCGGPGLSRVARRALAAGDAVRRL